MYLFTIFYERCDMFEKNSFNIYYLYTSHIASNGILGEYGSRSGEINKADC